MNLEEFKNLMQQIADGWMEQDVEKASDCFSDDAVYSQPPGKQYYSGKENILEFFNGVTPGAKMTWHNLGINGNIGFGEYSFEMNSKNHGVVVVELENRKIKKWREYQWSGNLSYEEFLNAK